LASWLVSGLAPPIPWQKLSLYDRHGPATIHR